tara:strand:- start:185 stop:712 length:528 start_codon:yes stop_codon:yes gene_type:complete
MNEILLKNKNIYLKNLTIDDNLNNYLSWINDKELTLYLNKNKTQTKIDLKNYIQYHSNLGNHLCGIFDSITYTHVGNVLLSRIDLINSNCNIGILIGKNYWGKGIGTSAVSLMTNYALDTLGLHKVIAGVVEENVGSARLFEKVGFTLEGIRKEEFKFKDTFLNTLYYGKIKNNE